MFISIAQPPDPHGRGRTQGRQQFYAASQLLQMSRGILADRQQFYAASQQLQMSRGTTQVVGTVTRAWCLRSLPFIPIQSSPATQRPRQSPGGRAIHPAAAPATQRRRQPPSGRASHPAAAPATQRPRQPPSGRAIHPAAAPPTQRRRRPPDGGARQPATASTPATATASSYRPLTCRQRSRASHVVPCLLQHL
jgi:hypothetical protein